jgi:hypothetical protein
MGRVEKEFTEDTDLVLDEDGYYRLTFSYFHLELEAGRWFDAAGVPEDDRRMVYFACLKFEDEERPLRTCFTIDEVETWEDLEDLFREEYLKRHASLRDEAIMITGCGLTASYADEEAE